MKRVLIICAAAMALVGAASAETRNLRGFTSVAAADRIAVEVLIGEGFRVEVIGADAARVRTEVEDGKLEIRQRNRPWFGPTPRLDARVIVTLPALEALAASRGAEISAEDVDAESMSLAASMGGTIEISGRCGALTAAAAMGGDIEAGDFQCASGDLSASMGGAMDVYASSSFDAAASMGGAINVAGNAQVREVASTMGGSVSAN